MHMAGVAERFDIDRLIAPPAAGVAAAVGMQASDLRVEYGGGLLTAREEHDAIAREMAISIVLTIVAVFVAIFLFFRRKRAIPLLGMALAAPVLVTFGIAELTVDYLHTATIFLGSIVIGNGVNPNIIWLARYFEERRGGHPVLDPELKYGLCVIGTVDPDRVLSQVHPNPGERLVLAKPS